MRAIMMTKIATRRARRRAVARLEGKAE